MGVLAGEITPEFGDALIVIDALALALFFGMIYAAKIAAGSGRILKLLSPALLALRFRLWRAAHKAH